MVMMVAFLSTSGGELLSSRLASFCLLEFAAGFLPFLSCTARECHYIIFLFSFDDDTRIPRSGNNGVIFFRIFTTKTEGRREEIRLFGFHYCTLE